MFLIRYNDPPVGESIYRLSPFPTGVDYPEGDLINVQSSQDNNIVIQRPIRDDRPRKWVWNSYRSTVPRYEAQYQFLRSITEKSLWNDGNLIMTVDVWEDESGVGGLDRFDATLFSAPDEAGLSNLIWTTARVSNVYRTSPKKGGPPVYDETVMEFYIQDAAYTDF